MTITVNLFGKDVSLEEGVERAGVYFDGTLEVSFKDGVLTLESKGFTGGMFKAVQTIRYNAASVTAPGGNGRLKVTGPADGKPVELHLRLPGGEPFWGRDYAAITAFPAAGPEGAAGFIVDHDNVRNLVRNDMKRAGHGSWFAWLGTSLDSLFRLELKCGEGVGEAGGSWNLFLDPAYFSGGPNGAPGGFDARFEVYARSIRTSVMQNAWLTGVGCRFSPGQGCAFMRFLPKGHVLDITPEVYIGGCPDQDGKNHPGLVLFNHTLVNGEFESTFRPEETQLRLAMAWRPRSDDGAPGILVHALKDENSIPLCLTAPSFNLGCRYRYPSSDGFILAAEGSIGEVDVAVRKIKVSKKAMSTVRIPRNGSIMKA